MRIRILFFYLISLGSIPIIAQEKFDYQWMVGYPPYGGDSSLFSACIMDFNGDS